MPAGRPTKYKKKYCDQLIQHMESGLSFETFAAQIDVNVDTLNEWCKRHSEFSVAKGRAFEKCRLFWEKKGIEGLTNQNFRKTTTDDNGRVVHSSVSKSMNARIWELNMKARFKDWRNLDKPDNESTSTEAPQLIIHVKQN